MNDIKKSFRELKWYEYIMGSIMILIAASSMFSSFSPGSNGNPPWLSVINFVSAICGTVCIFLSSRANISTFAFAIVNSVVYAIYLIYWRIWATATLEIFFYIPMNIMSWYAWSKHRDSSLTQKTKSRRLTLEWNFSCVLAVVLSSLICMVILKKLNGEVALFDSFTFSIGIVATILQLLRYREQYIWWIITDIISVGMYIVHFDAVYLTKRIIYLIVAVIGLDNWFKLNKFRNATNE